MNSIKTAMCHGAWQHLLVILHMLQFGRISQETTANSGLKACMVRQVKQISLTSS